MTKIVRFPGLALVLAVAFALTSAGLSTSGPASAQEIAPQKSASKSRKATATSSGPQVYLMRGLLNIFSLGMDDLAQKINAKGIRATVYNHTEWQGVSDEIAAKYKSGDRGAVILIGHSLGADAVMFMGEYLGKKGVPVALIVPFDGTGSFAASGNVQRVMNLTQRDYAHMRRGAGFRGELNNIDVTSQGVGHIDIDKSARLHSMVLNKISSVVGRGGGTRTAGEGSPAPRTRPASANPSDSAAPSLPSSAPSEAPAASEPAAPKPAPASTGSTSGASSERTASSEPAPRAEKPASAEVSAVRAPASKSVPAASKPGIRF